MKNRRENVLSQWLENDVNMIGHHAPGVKAVTGAVEKTKGLNNFRGGLRIREVA
jgi:hypothetical protein